MPFTAEHQPSLVIRSARSRNTTVVGGVALVGREKLTPADASHANMTFRGNHVRGVVACKECLKPRCLFSMDAPNRMKPAPSIHGIEPTNEEIKACREYAMHPLEAAMESDLYICGMQPLEPDNPMHKQIIARDGLECHDPVEFEYYNHPYHNAEWFKATMCAYCAGSSGHEGFIDEHLRGEWKSLLPVCQACRAKGALPLTRTRKRNGSARARQHETALLRDEIRDEREAQVERAEGAEAIQPARAAQR